MTKPPADFATLYRQSIETAGVFWRDAATRLDWIKPPTIIKNTSFHTPVSIKWFEDGVLNACYNCVDRHVPTQAQQTALIWEGDEPAESKHVTYAELKDEVCRLANALKSLGVKKGDRVTIYLPMICETVYALLACARIGAVHSVVFGGFSAEALADRIRDCESTVVLTAKEGRRGGKAVPLRVNVEKALESCADVRHVLTLSSIYRGEGQGEGDCADANQSAIASRRTTPLFLDPSPPQAGEREKFVDWRELVLQQSADCPCEPMNAEDPLFILYTSGSTGKPKGVLHTTGGYLLYAALTHEKIFDYRDGEVYWCTADVGWVTGHSYIVYGPLANGATTLVFEGVPTYPDAGRFWQVVDKHRVNIFYTAPTAIRALLCEGDAPVRATGRKSLRVLGSVGEPINPEAWQWFHDVVGDGRCPIVDTWWQTETGGHMITPLPSSPMNKPGCATKPFFGVRPVIVGADGKILDGVAEGALCIADSWPGQARTIYRDHARFEQTYFSTYKGLYFTGDGARRDTDGDYWITGRVDDVINVSGHRLGTAEVEAAINQTPGVAESAVVGMPHDLKGQGIYAYVIPRGGMTDDDVLKKSVLQTVRRVIGPIATPDVIHITNGLPKTRSGKIMRGILRKIAARETDNLGDISTLADPGVVDALIKNRPP